MFNRLKDYIIDQCTSEDFGFFEFPLSADSVVREEGQYWLVDYYVKEGGKPLSQLAIVRNFQNAIQEAGGKVLYVNDEDWWRVTGLFSKNGAETWVCVASRDLGSGYTVFAVQKGEMVQEITANAMLDSLVTKGRISLAINFNTGKSTIQSESLILVEQMAELLNDNANLNVEIQGHTDNVGKPDANMTLSDARAASVKQALVERGIESSRMSTIGFGDTKPVASNNTEEGRAANRRVVLVKK